MNFIYTLLDLSKATYLFYLNPFSSNSFHQGAHMRHESCALFQSVGQEEEWRDTFISFEDP